MAKLYIITKFSIYVMVLVSAGFTIERFTRIRKVPETAELVAKDLFYNASTPLSYNKLQPSLKTHYLKCVLYPSKPFCHMTTEKKQDLFQKEQETGTSNVKSIENNLRNVSSHFREKRRHMYNLMVDFIKVISTEHVEAFITEPSMLFCMLPQKQKYEMLSSGFSPSYLDGSINVVTFGVFEGDAKRLNKANVTDLLSTAGFNIFRIEKWMKLPSKLEDQSLQLLPVHYSFARGDMAIHVVVFYRRKSYMWHDGIDSKEVNIEDLLFEDEEIFENITLKRMQGPSLGVISNKISIPDHLPYFLKETKTSRLVECKDSKPEPEQFEVKVPLAVRELKAALAPRVVLLWLWSESYVGWLEQCNVLHYSPNLHLAVMSRDIERLNLIDILNRSSSFVFPNSWSMNLNTEYLMDFHGLQVNLTLLQEEQGNVWSQYQDGENIYKLLYPTFSVCSTDIYGEKVNVPCEADFLSKEQRIKMERKIFLNGASS